MKLPNGPRSDLRRPLLAAAWLLLLGLFAMVVGCAGGAPYPPGTFERAMYYVDNHKNIDAVAALESYVRHNPTDSLAAEAQYQKAMVYMDMKEYPLAAVEFQILRKDYPTCDRVEDSDFYEGVAYFRQVGKVQRDVTGAEEARLHFLELSQDFPNSKYMTEVRDYMQQISNLMVRKRLQQAKVFWQLGRYEAVKMTLGTALEDEAGSSLLDQVLWQRGRACLKLDDEDEAARMYERLLNEFPDSDYLSRAQAALRKINQEPELPEDTES